MAKGRKRGKGPPQPNGPRFMMPPPGGPPPPDVGWGRPPHPGNFRGPPPHPMGPPGPRMPGEPFPMGPPDFGPPHPSMMNEDPYFHDERMMRGPFMHGDLPPPEFAPRFPHPEFEERLRRFHPPEFEDGPPFPHPDFDGRPPERFLPEFEGRPGPGFFPPYDEGPPEFRGGPPGYHPPEYGEGPVYPMMDPACGPPGGYNAGDPNYMPPVGVHAMVPPPPPGPPPSDASQLASKQTKGENAKSASSKTVTSTIKNTAKLAKPPPGRSIGVISFIGNNYGFIEREDLKKFSFSFDAYFGKKIHLVPGVKVHFTAVKELGKECATDVKVAPRGTEEIDETVYEGVVVTVLPDTHLLESCPGRIRTILSTDPIKLPFGKDDAKVTLLLFDRVNFQLATDIITKETRATNILPQIPDTFQLTKEQRETGAVMNIKGDVCTIISKRHENLTASMKENLSDDELSLMDEVEFTAITIKDKVKAIRLKRLPEGSVVFDLQAKTKLAEAKERIIGPSAAKDKWKPVTSEVVPEEASEVSSEKYEGTIVKVITNIKEEGDETEELEPLQGLVDSIVADTQKRLPFRSGDVITKATMMVGDKVQFNISTNTETKEERAVNIEIQSDSFQTDSEEQRKIGVVLKLDDDSGFIRTPQDPQLFFELTEVMETTKLSLSEKVEFTLIGTKEGKRAIRIRRLTDSVFTSAPKLEGLGEKEKKKMTIKLLRDPTEQISNGDLAAGGKPEKGKIDASKPVKSTKAQKQDVKGTQEKGKVEEERGRSRESSRRRSRSRDRSSSYYGRRRSSSRERGYSRHRRSHSKDRSHRSRRSRSGSRSRDRSSRSGRKRSHSPEHRSGGRNGSKECSSRRRSRSPDKKTESQKSSSSKSVSSSSASEVVEDEIAKKRKELLELNELIARKRAIIAMEQNTKSFKDVLEMDRQHGFATFDYQHKTCLDTTWIPDMKPAKSILKKTSDPLTVPPHQTSKRSLSPEEPAEYLKSSISSPYASSPLPTQMKESSSSEFADPELERKKKQLEELNESIARKRAIVAMKQKVKTVPHEPEVQMQYDFASTHDDVDFSASSKSTWKLDIKPDLQPKKSILKKRSEPPPEQLQSDMTPTDPYSHPLYPHSKPPQDDYSTFSKPSGSFHTPTEKSTNPMNTVDMFKKLINEVSAKASKNESSSLNSPPGLRSFSPASHSGPFYSQKSPGEAKPSCSYEDTSSKSSSQSRQFSHQTHDQSSISEGPPAQPSTSEQKKNVATQMQRFLSALNKADSSLLSSLLREARKDSDSLAQKNPQVQPRRKGPHREELYDPFNESEEVEEKPFVMASKQSRNPVMGHAENYFEDHGDDDLLPHERAVQDGKGFSKIVGMKYGTEAKAENRFLYEEKKAPESQSRFSEPDLYEHHQGHYSEFEHPNHSVESYQNLYSNVQESRSDNREKYERQKELERYKVRGNQSPEHQTAEKTSDDAAKKTEHYEKLQSLLQTIGLQLDTAEVSKLADRTRERLYGKKFKSQSASSSSFDQKDEPSVGRQNRTGSRADSSDSEGVRSVSPTKSSNREVYMSYSDSVKYRDQRDELSLIQERDLVNLKRTIKNSPEARQVTPDPCRLAPSSKVARSSYSPTTELSSSSSSHPISVLSTQRAAESYSRQNSWESSSQDMVSPYGSVPPSPLLYAAGIQVPPPIIPPPTMPPIVMPPITIPPPTIPPGYGAYASPLFPVPPPYSTPNLYGPPPIYPPPTAQFDMSMQPVGSGYGTNQEKIKPAASTRCLKTIATVTSKEPVSPEPLLVSERPARISIPPTRAALINIQPLEETQSKESQGDDESKGAAPIMEEDIKAKQKKRLEQFNQRMRLKKEQQKEAQRTRGQSQKAAPGKVTRKELKNVWICGHSLVFWAEKRATSPEIGMQLGMDPNSVRIWWKGVQGMTWQQLLPQLLQLKDNWPKPDVILLHLGGNDIGKITTEAFLATVKKDLVSMKSIFPECLLVWSEILPRRSWRHSDDSAAVENTRKAINSSICSTITELGGSSLAHENIKPGLDTGLYRPDGVHLSGKGIDTFNLNMQDFLEKWESELNEDEASEA